jgi:hypothetical protein
MVVPPRQIEPLAFHRPGFVPSTVLLALFAIAQLLLLLLQPLPAMAADTKSLEAAKSTKAISE